MVLDNIEKLLEKYDNGETSLKEEEQLRNYFAQDEVAPHLESYKAMFQYFSTTKQEKFTKETPLNPDSYRERKRSHIYQWISIAAVALIMFGIFTQIDFGNDKRTLDDLNPQELAALNHTKEALNLISSKFNEGTSSFNVLGIAANQFEKGAEQVNQIEEFSKTTDKIFKNK